MLKWSDFSDPQQTQSPANMCRGLFLRSLEQRVAGEGEKGSGHGGDLVTVACWSYTSEQCVCDLPGAVIPSEGPSSGIICFNLSLP